MSKVNQVNKQTNNRFLNLYELEAEHRDGKVNPYYMASRSEKVQDLMVTTGKNTPDGVVIYGIYGEKKEKVARALFFTRFYFTLKYRPGSKNGKADVLSCQHDGK